jgi:hypothetical protein
VGEGADEAEFLNGIDCEFPYEDRERALALASEALRISTNAACGVVYEVCNVSADIDEDLETCREVLGLIERRIAHPLGKIVVPFAREVVDGGKFAAADRIALMRRVAPFKRQYAALQIALCGRDPDEPDDGEVDRVYDEIVASWD